ncbi:MAG: hypothetical protein LAP39_11705 [Acidobacteriia bacterium]|nr:hypothetical protein [Terriglobia bacterium]
MKKIAFALLLAGQLLLADSQNVRVVNGASFMQASSLTPGSIISILAVTSPGLTNSTAVASDFSNPPHTLGGVTVTAGTTTLPLFFVSAVQINTRLDPAIPAGPVTLTIQSPTGTFTKNLVLSKYSPPGVFSLFGSGTRDGAIQNAVTYHIGPYTTTTNGQPTYLSIYTSGLDLTAQPAVTIGGVSVPIQFYGAAPCCPALQQINVQLTPDLAGAGRVEVAVTANGMTSNITEVVILPNPGQGPFPPSGENQARYREISSVAWIPNTGLALVTDENDDVVRLVDIKSRKVVRTITLPEGSQPVSVAASGVAVVAERMRGKIAIIDLLAYSVIAEVAVGGAPVSVALAGNLAVVVNQDSDTSSVSAVDLTTHGVKNVGIARGARGIAVDSGANRAYVTNEDAGTISVIDLTHFTATPATISLPLHARPASIQLALPAGPLVVTEPSSGQILLVPTGGGAPIVAQANPDGKGPSDVAIVGNTLYFGNQAGGSLTVIEPISNIGSHTPPTITSVPIDLGVRSFAMDTQDKLLLTVCQGSGKLAFIDLNTSQVIDWVDAVRGELEAVAKNDHSDRLTAANSPKLINFSPTAGHGNSTISLSITGTNLTGATDLAFVSPATVFPHAPWEDGEYGQGANDPNFQISNVQVNAAGTQLTAAVTVGAGVKSNSRYILRVGTPNGDTGITQTNFNVFQVN